MSDIPIVKPVNVKEYDFKQSKYEVAPKLPCLYKLYQAPSRFCRKNNFITVSNFGHLQKLSLLVYMFLVSFNLMWIVYWTPVKEIY